MEGTLDLVEMDMLSLPAMDLLFGRFIFYFLFY
jgi:hypothetical protein